MKRKNGLFEKIVDIQNILLAHTNARKGKTHYKEVKMVDSDPNYYALAIKESLESGTYKVGKYHIMVKTVDSGKVREIYRLDYYPHRIVHHAILQVLEPIWVRSFIKTSYCCIKGRGIHLASNKIKAVLANNAADVRYCLKIDIQKFYPSVDNTTMKAIIRKKIKDKRLLALLDSTIDASNGLPIGNYLSQYMANLYLNYFDHWIKEVKGIRHYFRYCDDIVILGSDKAYLHSLRKEISVYMQDKLSLTVKNDWQVFPVSARGIDFLGYRFFHGRTLIRKRIAQKAFRISAKIEKHNECSSSQMLSLMSYWGWLIHCDSKGLRRNIYSDKVFHCVKVCSLRNGMCNPLQGKR